MFLARFKKQQILPLEFASFLSEEVKEKRMMESYMLI